MLAPILLALALAFGVPHFGSQSSAPSSTDPRTAPTETGPHAGDCYAGTHEALGDLEPDYASKVAYTEPHVWEIVGTVAVPEAVLDSSSAARSLKRREALATYGKDLTPLQRTFDATVLPRCRLALNELIGLADLPVGTGASIGARIEPMFGHALSWVNVMPAEAWAAGRTDAVCSMRFTNTDGESRPVQSVDSRPLVASWKTSTFPVVERSCISEDLENAACDETHMFEQLWVLNAADILQVGPTTRLSPAQEDRISLLCNLLHGAAVGQMPKRDSMLALHMPYNGDGWRTCIVRNRPNGKNLPMNPGFVAFAK
jgi:hypothetical protein